MRFQNPITNYHYFDNGEICDAILIKQFAASLYF